CCSCIQRNDPVTPGAVRVRAPLARAGCIPPVWSQRLQAGFAGRTTVRTEVAAKPSRGTARCSVREPFGAPGGGAMNQEQDDRGERSRPPDQGGAPRARPEPAPTPLRVLLVGTESAGALLPGTIDSAT